MVEREYQKVSAGYDARCTDDAQEPRSAALCSTEEHPRLIYQTYSDCKLLGQSFQRLFVLNEKLSDVLLAIKVLQVANPGWWFSLSDSLLSLLALHSILVWPLFSHHLERVIHSDSSAQFLLSVVTSATCRCPSIALSLSNPATSTDIAV